MGCREIVNRSHPNVKSSTFSAPLKLLYTGAEMTSTSPSIIPAPKPTPDPITRSVSTPAAQELLGDAQL